MDNLISVIKDDLGLRPVDVAAIKRESDAIEGDYILVTDKDGQAYYFAGDSFTDEEIMTFRMTFGVPSEIKTEESVRASKITDMAFAQYGLLPFEIEDIAIDYTSATEDVCSVCVTTLKGSYLPVFGVYSEADIDEAREVIALSDGMIARGTFLTPALEWLFKKHGVNVKDVNSITQKADGRYVAFLTEGTTLTVPRVLISADGELKKNQTIIQYTQNKVYDCDVYYVTTAGHEEKICSTRRFVSKDDDLFITAHNLYIENLQFAEQDYINFIIDIKEHGSQKLVFSVVFQKGRMIK